MTTELSDRQLERYARHVILDEVGEEILGVVLGLGRGGRTRSEELGHQEFILTYKSFEPIGPACLPAA